MYEHKGFKIEFDQQLAKFWTMIAGKRVTAPSLEAIKKRIDSFADNNFKPFTALLWDRWSHENVKEVTVIGVVKPRANVRHYRTVKWMVQGRGEESEVMEQSPENLKRIKAFIKRILEVEAAKTKLDAEISDLRDAIKMLVPEQ